MMNLGCKFSRSKKWLLLLKVLYLILFWQNIYNQGLQQGNENGKADCDCPECSIATGENETSVSNEILSKIPTTCKTFYDGCNTCNR